MTFPRNNSALLLAVLEPLPKVPTFVGPRTGTRHGYGWSLSYLPAAKDAKYAADILDPQDKLLERVYGPTEERCRSNAIADIERRQRDTVPQPSAEMAAIIADSHARQSEMNGRAFRMVESPDDCES